MQITNANAHLDEVVGQVFTHLLRQGGDQRSLPELDPLLDLSQQVVDLIQRLANYDHRIDDSGRTHDLLGDHAGVIAFVDTGSGADEDDLRRDREELLKGLRAVIHRARQPEAVVDERLFAAAVAFVHRANLRHGLVRLVDEADEVVGEVVDQAVGPLARLAAVKDSRIVFNPATETGLAHHLDVVLGALAQPQRLELLSLRLQLGAALLQLTADLLGGRLDASLFNVVMRRWPNCDVFEPVIKQLAGQRIELLQPLDLITEERDAVGALGVSREYLERFAANAKGSARQGDIVAGVLDRDQLAQQRVAIDALALAQNLDVVVVGLR
ncbi:unannotated protein [freshwater metagenome]|uniref:Unannotated protein n=1 Tax=freshwater metagenome TaxID=449393 RepID=A0A6J7RU52_9ZZZZ